MAAGMRRLITNAETDRALDEARTREDREMILTFIAWLLVTMVVVAWLWR